MRSRVLVFIITALVMITGTSVAMAAQLGDGTTGSVEQNITEVTPVTKPPVFDPVLEEFPLIERSSTTVAPTTTTTVTQAPPVASAFVASVDGESRWDRLAQCESGGNWARNSGNGFGGGLQFMHQPSYSTWLSFGGGEFAANPWEATREQQIVVAERVLARSGWNAWPGCSRSFGWL